MSFNRQPEQFKDGLGASSEIKEVLRTIPPMEEWPAVEILSSQVEKALDYFQKKYPYTSTEALAARLAEHFWKIAIYMRVSESRTGGIEDFERAENLENIRHNTQKILAEISRAEEQISQRSVSKTDHETDEDWLYIRRGVNPQLAYRIYFSPQPEAIGRVLAELENNIRSKIVFVMKTFNPKTTDARRLSRADKIVLSCSESDLAELWQDTVRMHQACKDDFTGRPFPGGGFKTSLQGVSVAENPSDGSSATEVIATKLEERLTKAAMQRAREWLSQKVAGKLVPREAAKLILEINHLPVFKRWPKSAPVKNYSPSLKSQVEIPGNSISGVEHIFRGIIHEYVIKASIQGVQLAGFSEQMREQLLKRASTELALNQYQIEALDSCGLVVPKALEIIESQIMRKIGLALVFEEQLRKSEDLRGTLKSLIKV